MGLFEKENPQLLHRHSDIHKWLLIAPLISFGFQSLPPPAVSSTSCVIRYYLNSWSHKLSVVASHSRDFLLTKCCTSSVGKIPFHEFIQANSCPFFKIQNMDHLPKDAFVCTGLKTKGEISLYGGFL